VRLGRGLRFVCVSSISFRRSRLRVALVCAAKSSLSWCGAWLVKVRESGFISFKFISESTISNATAASGSSTTRECRQRHFSQRLAALEWTFARHCYRTQIPMVFILALQRDASLTIVRRLFSSTRIRAPTCSINCGTHSRRPAMSR
jgi:hypothetical protein